MTSRTLTEHCNFGTLRDEMIRDRILIGFIDAKLSEKLQLDQELTQPKAIKQAQQRKAVKIQQTLMRSDFKETTGIKNEVDLSSQTVGESKEDYAFLGTIGIERNKDTCSVDLTLNNSPVHFKIDTRADVTVIPKSVCKKLKPNPALIQSSKTLFDPAHTTLPILGYFMGVIKRVEESLSREIFVVTGARLALLGRPAIVGLRIVQKVNAIEAEEVKEKLPNLFKGLGKLDGPDYLVELKSDENPHVISTPRRVHVPRLSKVEEEPFRMEQMQIISKVDEPTEWCAGMVVVPKADGKVRICVDLTKLNESILREYHPLPNIDHTLAQLAGATIFSKLDALSPESAKLTTFITPFGRFCFNRLPFGISSAPEHFQKRISQVLEETDGALCLMGDILVYGSSVEDHDEHLEATLHNLQEANLK
nr:uncharacterized protein LOC131782908 [Pocillopora verrucosa]